MSDDRHAELARRLEELDRAGDRAFGVIGRGELIVGLVVMVLVPLVIVWLAK